MARCGTALLNGPSRCRRPIDPILAGRRAPAILSGRAAVGASITEVYNMPRRYTMREHAVVMAHATALTELRRIASTRQRDFDDVARCHLWVSILCAALDARCND